MHYLLNALNYFASLRASRGDDPLTQEWKAKQIWAWLSLLLLLAGFGLSSLLADMLDTMDQNTILSAMSEQWRPTAAYVVGGGLSLLLLFTAYSWWAVIRFAQKHGAE